MRAGVCNPFAHVTMPPNCTVKVVERIAHSLVSLSWSDSTRCRYQEQVWERTIATAAGVCALSGNPIDKGDAIFRPQRGRRYVPLNHAAMILQVSLDRVDGSVSPVHSGCAGRDNGLP